MSSTFDRRIEPGFSATDKKIEPELAAGPRPAGAWWYRNGGTRVGPVTDEHMQALVRSKVVDRATMLWRNEFGENWKRLDETSLWTEPSAPPAFEQPVSPRWQNAFRAAADMEGVWSLINRTGTRRSMGQRLKAGWSLFSIPGFFFGPFYYFYLRMWQKGLLILAFIPVAIAIDGLIGWSKGLSSMVGILCAVNVKRDYFRFRTKGEVMWLDLDVFKNIYAGIGAVAAGVALFIGVAYLESPQDDASGIAPNKAVADTTATHGGTAGSNLGSRPLPSGTISVEARRDFEHSSDGYTYSLTITSKVNGITISGVEANRGNCITSVFNPGLKHFGETAVGLALCKPIELKVMTSMGTGSFSFDD